MFAFKIIIYSFQIIKFSTFEMKGEQLFKKTKTDKKVVLLSPRLSYCLLNKEDFRIYLEADSWLPIPLSTHSGIGICHCISFKFPLAPQFVMCRSLDNCNTDRRIIVIQYM